MALHSRSHITAETLIFALLFFIFFHFAKRFMRDCDKSCHFHCSHCWYMTPAALWVTWTQPHMIITAAISDYQSQLIQSACFTLHNWPIISILHLSVSLKQLIFHWNRYVTAGGVKEQTIFLFGWWQSLWVWINPGLILFLIPLLQHERSPEDQVRSASSSVCSRLQRTAGESLHPSCPLLRTVWVEGEVAGANPPDASHFYLDLSDCFSIILLQQKLLDVLISPFGRDVVSLLCKYHSSSSVYTGVIDTPVCSPGVFRFIQS